METINFLEKIKNCFERDAVLYSNHAKEEMRIEEFGKIIDDEVFEAVCNGQIIENYPFHKPYPSALIFGYTTKQRPIYIVCAYNESDKIAIVITVYQPNPELWIDFKRRIKK